MTSDAADRETRLQLDRVLSSQGFARNERMSRFLRFLVERHLAGRGDELKESVIGVEVFGRRPDYDPKQDSIVRTEAARLRARLAEYYAGQGRADPVVIELPKGGYVPASRRVRRAAASRLRPIAAVAVAVIGLVAIAVGSWLVLRERPPVTIAVLPFESQGPDAGDGYFADGLTDDLSRHLSAIEGLAVRSHTSTFAFRETPRNVRDVARQLDAEYLVEGVVRREGQALRVDARLVRVRDDRAIWSGRFDKQLADVFALQDELSRGIANRLRLQLGGGRWRYETSVEAYDWYLRGRAEATGYARITRSIDLFEQAIAVDPSFAPAYADLASAFAIRSAQFAVDHPDGELDQMREVARKAVELDPLLADAHASLALAFARDGDWRLAEESFRRAIELDPSRSTTRRDLAMWLLYPLGRDAEALAQLRAAERSDPLSPDVQAGLSWVLLSLGRPREAAGHCERLPDGYSLTPQCKGRVQLAEGRLGGAIDLFAQDPSVADSPQARGFLGYAYGRAGRVDEAERMAAAATDANERALIHAGLGQADETLSALEDMGALGAQRVGRYLQYPELAFLRTDTRVTVLRRRIGLP